MGLLAICRDRICLVATVERDVAPLLVLEFLHRTVDIFVDYFGPDESAIKDNFSMVYQLLEEMLDDGSPLTTEPNALKAMIRPPSVIGCKSSELFLFFHHHQILMAVASCCSKKEVGYYYYYYYIEY